MGHSLNGDLKIVGDAVPPTVAGTTDINGAIIDITGFDGILFYVNFGTLTATQVTRIKAQQDSDPSGTTMTDLAGTLSVAMADGDSGKGLILDVHKPQKRYVRCVVDRGTANAVINYGVALLYGATNKPVSLHSSVVSQEVHVSPSEGTA